MNRHSEERWLGQYAAPVLIHRGPAVQLHSTQLVAQAAPRVVVTASPGAGERLVAQRLDEMARVHRLVAHPRIPAVAERGRRDGVEFLGFACPAVIDGAEVLRRLASHGLRMSFDAADAFISGLREALQAGHAVIDPDTGRPICAGTLSYANALFDSEGQYWLLALGGNPLASLDTGAPSGEMTFYAPEIVAGGHANPSGDYVALRLFMRSLLPYVELPSQLARVLQGDIRAEDAELMETLLWLEQRVMLAPAKDRASVAEAVVVAEKFRVLLGTSLDDAAFSRVVRELFDAEATPLPSVQHWTVDSQGRWLQRPDGERVDLASHAAIGRIVVALANAQASGTSLEVADLLAAGWPGERVEGRAGANRVYVAISTLRKMGLRGVLQKRGRGYCLAARPAVVFSIGSAPRTVS